MAKTRKKPTADQESERLRQKFHTVTAPMKVGVEREATAKPDTPDQKLAASLSTYLEDDRAKNILAWLDLEAANANRRAHIATATGKSNVYSLGQESAFRSMARKIREIRGESTPQS